MEAGGEGGGGGGCRRRARPALPEARFLQSPFIPREKLQVPSPPGLRGPVDVVHMGFSPDSCCAPLRSRTQKAPNLGTLHVPAPRPVPCFFPVVALRTVNTERVSTRAWSSAHTPGVHAACQNTRRARSASLRTFSSVRICRICPLEIPGCLVLSHVSFLIT